MKKFLMVVIVLLIIAAIGVGGWYFYTNQQRANDEIEKLKNEISGLKNEEDYSNSIVTTTTTNVSTSKALKISDLIGAYDNGEGEDKYQSLCVYENGTFEYYTSGRTDEHEEGYYVINENKVTFYAILGCANDPGAKVINKKYEIDVNNGTIIINNVTMRKSNAAQTRYNKENGGVDLGNEISSRLKNNFLTAD